MTTILFSHADCLEHDPGSQHPDLPSRLKAIESGLTGDEFADLLRREAPMADLKTLELVHPPAHIERVLYTIPERGRASIDADTTVSKGSRVAALRGVGAVCAGVDAVIAGEARNVFCAIRPPGHHAEPRRSMGFCLFSNIAIGALHARRNHGLARVAVVDFDVHHGNGTQAVFEEDETLFYGSTHQMPLYPGTGAASECGVGNIVNVPLRPGDGGPEFRTAMEKKILPALDAFAPEMVLVSAGFDAHRCDPLAGLELEDSDFAYATKRLMDIAARHAKGRLVSALEGGYDHASLRSASAAHVRALMA
ncbi:MAG: histone deacetylase family protein [Alphaproteobacteria bacterium]|nr:histone deacetylase family protein [Alphaproteobacteria bacterium]